MEARANGNTPRREGLARDIIGADVEISSDYNAALAELIEHHRNAFMIRSHIIDTRSRAIAAMLSADISRREIARLLRMSYRQINRIIRNITD
jgi:DNA-binding CsgD family transcriptional regulator